MPINTADLSLSAALAQGQADGLSNVQMMQILLHGAVQTDDWQIPVETVPNDGTVDLTQPITEVTTVDAAGHTDAPTILDLQTSSAQFGGAQVNDDAFTHLHSIVMSDDGSGSPELTLTGSHNEQIVLGAPITPGDASYQVFLNDTGTDSVSLGDNNAFVDTAAGTGSDHITGGNGTVSVYLQGDDQFVTLGNGSDQVHAYGSGEHVNVGNGAGDGLAAFVGSANDVLQGNGDSAQFTLFDGAGDNNTLIGAGANDTFTVGGGFNDLVQATGIGANVTDGAIGSLTVNAKAGDAVASIGNGEATTLQLGGSAGNTVHIADAAATVIVKGIAGDAQINWGDAQANLTITQTTGTQLQVHASDTGAVETLNFVSHQALVSAESHFAYGV